MTRSSLAYLWGMGNHLSNQNNNNSVVSFRQRNPRVGAIARVLSGGLSLLSWLMHSPNLIQKVPSCMYVIYVTLQKQAGCYVSEYLKLSLEFSLIRGALVLFVRSSCVTDTYIVSPKALSSTAVLIS